MSSIIDVLQSPYFYSEVIIVVFIFEEILIQQTVQTLSHPYIFFTVSNSIHEYSKDRNCWANVIHGLQHYYSIPLQHSDSFIDVKDWNFCISYSLLLILVSFTQFTFLKHLKINIKNKLNYFVYMFY